MNLTFRTIYAPPAFNEKNISHQNNYSNWKDRAHIRSTDVIDLNYTIGFILCLYIDYKLLYLKYNPLLSRLGYLLALCAGQTIYLARD